MQHPKHDVEKAEAVHIILKNGVSLTVRKEQAAFCLGCLSPLDVSLIAKQGDAQIVEAHLLLPFKKAQDLQL